MAKFTLISAHITYVISNKRFVTDALYKQRPDDQNECPQHIIIFDELPLFEIDVDPVEFQLKGIYVRAEVDDKKDTLRKIKEVKEQLSMLK